MWLLSTSVSDGATGVSTGRGGATDSHGHRVRVFIPADPERKRSGAITFACWCRAALNGEASGLVPEVLHVTSRWPQKFSKDYMLRSRNVQPDDSRASPASHPIKCRFWCSCDRSYCVAIDSGPRPDEPTSLITAGGRQL